MKKNKTQGSFRRYISDKQSQWIEQADHYDINHEWLEKSALIAVKILSTLRTQAITQKDLAQYIGVSPQYINKVVKGRENLSLETIAKIEKSLGIVLLVIPTFEKSQVISDSFLTTSESVPRNNSKPVGSENVEYSKGDVYKPTEKQAFKQIAA